MRVQVWQSLGMVALVLTAGSLGTAQGFDWEQFKGQMVSVQVVKSPWSDYLAQRLPEFEKLSGINVNLSILPEQQARQKLVIDFASGGATVDVFDTSLHVEKTRFSKAGWYEDLAPYLANKKLTDPQYVFGDFFSSGRSAVRTKDGKTIGLPYKVDVQVLYYRKDLFAAKNIPVPTTLNDLDKAAAALHSPPALYGFASRGLKNANVYTLAMPMQYFKAQYVSPMGKAQVSSPEAVKAIGWYADILRKYAPQGVTSYNWSEVLGLFQQGQLAMFNDGIGFATQLEDPKSSKVAGKVGYALLPGNLAPATYNALALSPRAKNKEAAYLFMQWATGRNFDTGLVENGITSPRISSWQDAKNKPLDTIPWAKTYFEALKVAKPAFPEVSAITELRDIVGIAIVEALQGQDVSGAAQNANAQLQTVLDSTER